jgi:predicted hydrocarbon binding protein
MMSQRARGRIREEPVQLSEPDEGKMIKLAMQTLSEHYGMHRGRGRRAARVLGHQLGADLAARFVSTDLTAVVEELSRFWKRNGIGDVVWHDKDNLELAVRYSGETVEDKQMLCPFKEGLIEALLKKRLSEQVAVKETECAGKQEGSNCIFKITTP